MPRNPRGSWGRRLLWTQMAVVATMAATTVLTALLVGPAWFRMHMPRPTASDTRPASWKAC